MAKKLDKTEKIMAIVGILIIIGIAYYYMNYGFSHVMYDPKSNVTFQACKQSLGRFC